jgi:hypothetical protein
MFSNISSLNRILKSLTSNESNSLEAIRTYTRAAQDPFLCFRGANAEDEGDEMTEEDLAKAINVNIKADPKKAFEEKKKFYSDPMDDPDVLRQIKEVYINEQTDNGERNFFDESDDQDDDKNDDNKEGNENHIETVAKEKQNLSMSEYFHSKNDGGSILKERKNLAKETLRLIEISKQPDLVLISGLLPPNMELEIAAQLDRYAKCL